MKKLAQGEAFWKAQKKHKHLGFDGMVFLAYVAEFEAQGLRCFVSRAKIAEELPISESGARYLIKRLVQSGHLFVCYEGRKRYLSTTKQGGKIKPDEGANSAPRGGTIKPIEGAELNQMRGHEKATTKNQYKEILQRNNYKETNYKELRNQKAGRGSLKREFFISDQETEAEKEAYLAFKRSLLGK